MRRKPKATHKAKRPTGRQRKITLSQFNAWLKAGSPSEGEPLRKVSDATNS